MTEKRGIEYLSTTVQELSLARDIDTVMRIVRKVARELTHADGATFVLREGDLCFYADEDAISPLWKGNRFPMRSCISGWVMNHRKPTVIEDIYDDPRIPLEAYSVTFVKSLAMVPIRTINPIGAIGAYWAQKHIPSDEELRLLQALADITAVSIENITIYSELERKLQERTAMLAQLSTQNSQLAEFCHIISHNLRAPLVNLAMISDMIEDSDSLDETRQYVDKLSPIIHLLQETFEGLVDATQVRMDLTIHKDKVDLEEATQQVLSTLKADLIEANGAVITDFTHVGSIRYPRKYIDTILFNLLHNAIRYHSPDRLPHISIRSFIENGWIFLEISDNGLGIDMEKNSEKLFKLRKTFHSHPDSKGFGLFIARTQVEAMGGTISASSTPGMGSSFLVKLCKTED